MRRGGVGGDPQGGINQEEVRFQAGLEAEFQDLIRQERRLADSAINPNALNFVTTMIGIFARDPSTLALRGPLTVGSVLLSEKGVVLNKVPNVRDAIPDALEDVAEGVLFATLTMASALAIYTTLTMAGEYLEGPSTTEPSEDAASSLVTATTQIATAAALGATTGAIRVINYYALRGGGRHQEDRDQGRDR